MKKYSFSLFFLTLFFSCFSQSNLGSEIQETQSLDGVDCTLLNPTFEILGVISENDSTQFVCPFDTVAIVPHFSFWPTDQPLGNIAIYNNGVLISSFVAQDTLRVEGVSGYRNHLRLELTTAFGCSLTHEFEKNIFQFPEIQVVNEHFFVCTGADELVVPNLDPISIIDDSEWTYSRSHYLIDEATFYLPLQISSADPDAVWSCGDSLAIHLNLEHSNARDLKLRLICPTGFGVEFQNGVDILNNDVFYGYASPWDGALEIGDPLRYTWSFAGTSDINDHQNIVTYATQNGQLFPYAPIIDNNYTYNFSTNSCALNTCPINGTWKLLIVDAVSFNDGHLFDWKLEFASGVLDQNEYQFGSGSISWDTTVANVNPDGQSITIPTDSPTEYAIPYVYTNPIGCTSADTIAVSVIESNYELYAGDDFVYSSSNFFSTAEVNFNSTCTADTLMEFCLRNNMDTLFTVCLSDFSPCTGILGLEVVEGVTEYGSDKFVVNDSDGFGYQSAIYMSGIFTGEQYTFNSGCASIEIRTDESVSCEDGDYGHLKLRFSLVGDYPFVASWSPTEDANQLDYYSARFSYNEPGIYDLVANLDIAGYESCSQTDTVQMTLLDYIYHAIVFEDANNNGIMESDETRLQNIPIEYNDYYMVWSNEEGVADSDYTLEDCVAAIKYNAELWTPTTDTVQYATVSDFTPQGYTLYFGLKANTPHQSTAMSGIVSETGCFSGYETFEISVLNTGNQTINGKIQFATQSNNSLLSVNAPYTFENNLLVIPISNFKPTESRRIVIKYIDLVITTNNTDMFAYASFSVLESNGSYTLSSQTTISEEIDCTDMGYFEITNGYSEDNIFAPNSQLNFAFKLANMTTANQRFLYLNQRIPDCIDPLQFLFAHHSHPIKMTLYNDTILNFNLLNTSVPPLNNEDPNVLIEFIGRTFPNYTSPTPIPFRTLQNGFNNLPITHQNDIMIVPCSITNFTIENEGNQLLVVPRGFAYDSQWTWNKDQLPSDFSNTLDIAGEGNYMVSFTLPDGCPMHLTTSITSVENMEENGISVYPSPMQETVNWSSQQPINSVRIYNQLGQVVCTAQAPGKSGTIDVSHLASGTYIVEIGGEHVRVIKY